MFATAPHTEPGRPPRVGSAGLAEQESRALEEFEQHFGVHFHDPGLLRLALTHRSYLHVTGQGPRESNERLEFLGDSVLGLVTSEHLYRKHPNEHEGQLTKTKSLLVSKAILSRRALAMGLGRFVFMSHSEVESGGRQRLSILADAFESVVGAIYLDQGFEASRAWLDRWLLRDARIITADKRHTNYKSHLQEYVQSTFRTHPVYRIRSAMGPDHSKMFMVEVMVGRKVLGEGRGKNKKEAEQAAARDALERAGSPVTREEEETRSARAARRESRVMSTLLPEPDLGEPSTLRATGDEDDDEPRRRRRGRRGGRARRDREVEPPVSRPAPVVAEPPARVTTRVAPPPRRARRVRLDEDMEEVGRPEGFAHESGDLPHLTTWAAPEAVTVGEPVSRPEPAPEPETTRRWPVVSEEDAIDPEPERVTPRARPATAPPARVPPTRRVDEPVRTVGESGAGRREPSPPVAEPASERHEPATRDTDESKTPPGSGSFGRRARRGR
ncbi:MAG: ribonuclease III [Candidatus Eisenbacteria bacterium]